MWKWLLVVLLVVGLSLIPTVALADSSVDVTVTATGWVCGAPGGLVITYVSDTEVKLDWVKGEDAVNTMVRAKYGSAPTSRADGYQVYYGDGTTATDTGVNFDEGVSDVYYILFSQNAGGYWEETGASGFMENPYMLLIVLVLLALGFTIASYIFKKGMLAFAGAASWMITSIYCFSRSTVNWDTYFSLAFLFVGLTLACSFSPLAWRETTPEGETPEEPDVTDLREEMEEVNKIRNQYAFLYGKRQPKRRVSRRLTQRLSKFERTGEE